MIELGRHGIPKVQTALPDVKVGESPLFGINFHGLRLYDATASTRRAGRSEGEMSLLNARDILTKMLHDINTLPLNKYGEDKSLETIGKTPFGKVQDAFAIIAKYALYDKDGEKFQEKIKPISEDNARNLSLRVIQKPHEASEPGHIILHVFDPSHQDQDMYPSYEYGVTLYLLDSNNYANALQITDYRDGLKLTPVAHPDQMKKRNGLMSAGEHRESLIALSLMARNLLDLNVTPKATGFPPMKS